MDVHQERREQMDVTVVVPMHNARDTISRCLESIRSQTLAAARVVVVDDASTDGSLDALSHLKLTGLQVVPLACNVGPGAARNRGVERATTEWVAFLDADNTWEPGFLAESVAALAASGADFVSSGGTRQLKYPTVRTIRRVMPNTPGGLFGSAAFWRIALRFLPVVPSSMVVRRSLFDSVGGFPEDARTGEDVTLAARLWLHGRFAFINRPLYVSVQQAGSLTAQRRAYLDLARLMHRVGIVLLQAIRARKPGTAWFVLAYARMIVGRHAVWLAGLVHRPWPARDRLRTRP